MVLRVLSHNTGEGTPSTQRRNRASRGSPALGRKAVCVCARARAWGVRDLPETAQLGHVSRGRVRRVSLRHKVLRSATPSCAVPSAAKHPAGERGQVAPTAKPGSTRPGAACAASVKCVRAVERRATRVWRATHVCECVCVCVFVRVVVRACGSSCVLCVCARMRERMRPGPGTVTSMTMLRLQRTTLSSKFVSPNLSSITTKCLRHDHHWIATLGSNRWMHFTYGRLTPVPPHGSPHPPRQISDW
jgi:hypothetical protein